MVRVICPCWFCCAPVRCDDRQAPVATDLSISRRFVLARRKNKKVSKIPVVQLHLTKKKTRKKTKMQSEKPWEADTTIANIMALAGSVGVILLWLAPVRDVWSSRTSIWATKSTSAIVTAFPYVAGMYNCILWNSEFFRG